MVWQQLLRTCRQAGIEVMYTVMESLTQDGRDRSLDYKISGADSLLEDLLYTTCAYTCVRLFLWLSCPFQACKNVMLFWSLSSAQFPL